MADPKNLLPPCGLYRTTRNLSGHEDRVQAGMLVYFHNHSDGGLPMVLVPDHNVHNRWHFHGPGIDFRGLSWAQTLEKVPEEGFYVLRRELKFDGGSWPKNTLVQLGYTRGADPILFIARQRARLAENDLWFSDKGVALPRTDLTLLDAVQLFREEDDGTGDHAPSHTH